MANVKGTALASRLTWIRLQHGPDGLARVTRDASEPLAALIAGGARTEAWYPFALFVELNDVIDRAFGAGDGALAKELGRHGADANMTTIYRLFFKLGSVRWVIARAARLWHMHYDAGRLEVVDRGTRQVDLHLVGVPEPSCTHCRAVQGWAERSIELSGGTDVATDLHACRCHGGASCCISARWK
ncbi:MAG TPA: hypothetical protein VHE35_10535 [Kofleriaceae bacterium]|nr:hypothetical protein [Kofleriaceae bacterium]